MKVIATISPSKALKIASLNHQDLLWVISKPKFQYFAENANLILSLINTKLHIEICANIYANMLLSEGQPQIQCFFQFYESDWLRVGARFRIPYHPKENFKIWLIKKKFAFYKEILF